jgi:hypothetical protein
MLLRGVNACNFIGFGIAIIATFAQPELKYLTQTLHALYAEKCIYLKLFFRGLKNI